MNRFSSTYVAPVVLGLGMLSLAGTAQGAPNLASWKQSIAKTPAPAAGCFSADFPSVQWRRISCTVAPLRPYVPRSGGTSRTVGDGDDYAAVSGANLTSAATGSFPVVSGVTSEKNNGHSSEYSLQLNSNFFSGSKACAKAKKPASCLSWEQFVFSEEGGPEAGGLLFIQYWLIGFNKKCPSGWMTFGSDCFRNSDSAVNVPKQTIQQLGNLQLTGSTVSGGLDTIALTTAAHAYSVTESDSVVTLAKFWNASEFNVIGNGNASGAVFNKGASITVNIALADGVTTAPVCQANAGTTGETNNLKLGKCNVSAGALPSVKFTESR
jgi:hypothetical protein